MLQKKVMYFEFLQKNLKTTLVFLYNETEKECMDATWLSFRSSSHEYLSYGALKTTLDICYTDNDNMNNDDANNVDNDNVNVKYNFLTISFHYILFVR